VRYIRQVEVPIVHERVVLFVGPSQEPSSAHVEVIETELLLRQLSERYERE
jgi:hypothetical protein